MLAPLMDNALPDAMRPMAELVNVAALLPAISERLPTACNAPLFASTVLRLTVSAPFEARLPLLVSEAAVTVPLPAVSAESTRLPLLASVPATLIVFDPAVAPIAPPLSSDASPSARRSAVSTPPAMFTSESAPSLVKVTGAAPVTACAAITPVAALVRVTALAPP